MLVYATLSCNLHAGYIFASWYKKYEILAQQTLIVKP